MKLSICMMVKNEEKNIKRCLDNLKPLVENDIAELIIVDTGSTDNTINIAKEYTGNVFFHKWNKDFSEMRNKTISYAAGEWIFIIDADERLDDFEKLKTLMNSSEINNFNTILLKIKNLVNLSDEDRYDLITSPRIFKNDGKFKYEGSVHNQPIFKGPNLSVDINITHFGYITNDKDLMDKKFKRTTELLQLELKKNPKDLYYIYQLGTSYDMHGDSKEALDEFRKAYNILKFKKLKERIGYAYIYASHARIAYLNNEYNESIKIAKEGLELKNNYVDLYYLIGLIEKTRGNKGESYEYFKKYIDLVDNYNELDISKDLSVIMYHVDDKSKSNAYYEVFQYFLRAQKYEDAFNIYNNIINGNEKISAAIGLFIPTENYTELRKAYNDLSSIKEKDFFLCFLQEKIKKLTEKQKSNIYHEFSYNEDSYGLFSRIKISNNQQEKINLTKDLIIELDFNKQPLFYCEVFENIKECNNIILNVFKKIEVWNLKNIIKNLIEKNEFKEIYENYILNQVNYENIQDVEIEKVYITMASTLLLTYIKDNKEVGHKYLNIFKSYINLGISFIQKIYRLDNAEFIYKSVSNQEDRFFIIMYIINDLIRENNQKSAVTYMIEAVHTYEAFAKYIDIYKNEIFKLNLINDKDAEFENYKLKIKENINSLISNSLLQEAKELIYEYEEIISDDIEICSCKSIIAIMENNFEEAELLLKEGLGIDNNNFDLLYNLGYLFEFQDRQKEALAAYNVAKLVSNNEDNCRLAESKISTLINKNNIKYNVIFCGKTEQCIKFQNIFKEWNIIGYINYDNENVINEKLIQINNIENYNYDFIMILDEVNENKILDKMRKYNIKKNIYLYSEFKTSVIEGFDYRIRDLLYKNNIEVIITGSSYAEVGIKVDKVNRNAINFAFSSQDLYYDYQIANYILNYKNVKNSIKYAILGLSYYCFDYDMSISIAKYRIHRYINYIHDLHNNKDEIGINITKAFYEKKVGLKEYLEMNKYKENARIKYRDVDQEYIAKKNSTMNYESTRKENIDILYKYLNLLKINNIKPIIIICPTSKYYYEYFKDNYQKTKFYKTLDIYRKDFDFQVIDYLNSELFEDEDFWDYGHLNGKGAEKFTNILNEEILW